MPMLCLPETVATRSYMDAAPRKRLMLRTGAATSCGGASAMLCGAAEAALLVSVVDDILVNWLLWREVLLLWRSWNV